MGRRRRRRRRERSGEEGIRDGSFVATESRMDFVFLLPLLLVFFLSLIYLSSFLLGCLLYLFVLLLLLLLLQKKKSCVVEGRGNEISRRFKAAFGQKSISGKERKTTFKFPYFLPLFSLYYIHCIFTLAGPGQKLREKRNASLGKCSSLF